MTFFSLPRNRKITLCEEHFEESCFSESVDLGRRLMKSKEINLYLISFLIYNVYWRHFPCSFTFWVKLLAIYFTANGLPRILLMDSSQPYFPTRNKKNNKKRDFSTGVFFLRTLTVAASEDESTTKPNYCTRHPDGTNVIFQWFVLNYFGNPSKWAGNNIFLCRPKVKMRQN